MNTQVRVILRRVKHFAVDNLELLSGRRDRLTPPKRLIFVGDGDFSAVGNEFLEYFVKLGGLEPWHRVLDVGSGIGRMAVPLTRFLGERGSYDGLDISRIGVDWCNRNVHKRHKNFRFHHADILNLVYNPTGKLLSRHYTLPFPDSHYDFVFLTSVFTHMLEDDVVQYISEISRVMKPGAKGLFTFFLINDESLGLIALGRGDRRFVKYHQHMYVEDPQIPEAVSGYEEAWVRAGLWASGMPISGQIHYGRWCGREQCLSYQDILTVTKT